MNGVVRITYLVSVPGANRSRHALLWSAPADSDHQALGLVKKFLAENKHLDESAVSAVFVPHSVWLC